MTEEDHISLKEFLLARMNSDREHFETVINALRDSVEAEARASKKAIEVAMEAVKEAKVQFDETLKGRLEGLNELRQVVDKVVALNVTKDEMLAMKELLLREMEPMKEYMAAERSEQKGKTEQWTTFQKLMVTAATAFGLYGAYTTFVEKTPQTTTVESDRTIIQSPVERGE